MSEKVIHFRRTPMDVSDKEFVSTWWDVAVELMQTEAKHLMAENQLWTDGPALPKAIDLRGRNIDARYEYHGTFRGKQEWTCWDYNSYDGDESAMGSGDSKEAALLDLLEKIAPDEPELVLGLLIAMAFI